MLDASSVLQGKHQRRWSEATLSISPRPRGQASRLPRKGAMLTLVVDVLQIGIGDLSPFEVTVSPVRRSDLEESKRSRGPMGEAKTMVTSLRGACSDSDWWSAVEVGMFYIFLSNAEGIGVLSRAGSGNNLRRPDETPYSLDDDQDHVVSL